ncbi:MAG: excinuclease ABC subunit C, partial [Clostridia bacterium]|nr:excinuclease ABC subunit C [Clostridia bacterium]
QEEVHRYSVEYHRTKHKKSSLNSALLSIDGIGKARADELLKKFKTMKAISQASVEELAAVKGMSLKSAQAVKEAFENSDK